MKSAKWQRILINLAQTTVRKNNTKGRWTEREQAKLELMCTKNCRRHKRFKEVTHAHLVFRKQWQNRIFTVITIFILMFVVWFKSVFALSGIASQNATQVDPPCDSKCHMRRIHVRYKRKHRLFDKNTQCQGGWQWIKNAVVRSPF